MIASGSDMPYVGFTLPLLAPILLVSALAIIYFGWGSKPKDKQEILSKLPESSADISWWRIVVPPIVLIGIFLISYYFPFQIPTLGLPLTFVIATVVAILCNPKKPSLKDCWNVLDKTMEQIFPLIATVLSVGILQNAMSATGVKGLIGITFITLPLVWIYISILFVAPLLQGSLNYGSAVVFGAPLIFLFNTMGVNLTIVATAMSLIFPIGDCLPSSRITGRLSCEVVGYEGTYKSFLNATIVPCAILAAVALIMMVLPDKFAFLVH